MLFIVINVSWLNNVNNVTKFRLDFIKIHRKLAAFYSLLFLLSVKKILCSVIKLLISSHCRRIDLKQTSYILSLFLIIYAVKHIIGIRTYIVLEWVAYRSFPIYLFHCSMNYKISDVSISFWRSTIKFLQ